jgi:hypothetical protein
MAKTSKIRIGLRCWFAFSVAVCLLAGDYWAAASCGFFWAMTE